MNKFTFIGRLARDAEVRTTEGGTTVGNFVIALNRRISKDKEKENEKTADFIRITCFGKRAEVAGEYFKKGILLYVEGSVRNNIYEKDGEKIYSNEFILNDFEFLGRNTKKTDSDAEVSQAPDGFVYSAEDADLPF